MVRYSLLPLLILFISHYSINAQEVQLVGTVMDKNTSEPLPGANIIFQKNYYGAATDGDGNFTMSVPPGDHQVHISFTGYKTRKLALQLQNDTSITIYLTPLEQMLEQVVVSASKYATPISEVTVSMEVLSAESIENINATSIDEAIQRVPGVTILDGQPNIRGGSGYSYGAGSRVMVLIDGMPILTGDAGFPAWSFLPMENIEQVEVIKGASSALYGSSALNGIINLRTTYATSEPVTKISYFSGFYGKPEDNITDEITSVQWQIENGDTLGADTLFREKAWWDGNVPFFTGASLLHKQRFGKFDLVAGAYIFSEDSYLKEDFTRRARGNINTRYRTKIEGLSLSLNSVFMYNRSANFFMWQGDRADAYLPLPNTITNSKGIKFSLDPAITYISPKNNKHLLQARWYKNDNYTGNDQSTLSDYYYGEYQYQHDWKKINMVLTSGVTGSYSTVEAELYGDSVHQSSNGAIYFQLDKRFFGKLNLSAGGRIETNQINDEERETKPVVRVGANYQLLKGTFIRASYGEGYRFPTIAEKYIRTNIGIISIYPNPELESETGWSAELAVKQAISIGEWKAYADLAVFYTAYQDMMEFSFGQVGNAFGFQSRNIGNTLIKGAEISIAGQGKIGTIPLRILAGYTYIDPVFADFDSLTEANSSADHNILKYRFRHSANINLETTLRRIFFSTAIQYQSEMEAIDRVFEVFLPGVRDFRETHQEGVWIIDAEVGVLIKEQNRLSVVVKNILNQEYTLRPALMEAPRSYTLKLTLNF